jgi:hypothetical protein
MTLRIWISALLAFVFSACAGGSPAPDWQLDAHGALDRSVRAGLRGDARVAASEFARARAQTAYTGRADWVARVELVRCAVQIASLNVGPCVGFEALRVDASPAERAYDAYLAGRITADQVALLPEAQRTVAQALAARGPASGTTGPQRVDPALLRRIEDPFSRLVAAGVVVRAGAASAAVAEIAVETASAQGWRRPLLTWLELQRRAAQQSGDTAKVSALARRIELVSGQPAHP